jgi:hypothetical protein
MDAKLRAELEAFLSRASKATYAGNGSEAESQRAGFKELEYREGDWYYRDSYAGSLRSWGQEVIWRNNEPVWMRSYGEGMSDTHMDSEFAGETFSLLKKALSADDTELVFQPRGPKEFHEGDWMYHCNVEGDIEKFTGHESISYKDQVVFVHDFLGGTVIPR